MINKTNNHKHTINDTGILTHIWGPSTWNSLHCISFSYPENPTDSDKEYYKAYFQLLKFVLPCCICRKHFTEHTKIGGKHEINNDIFENRSSLTKWLYNLHNDVDESLGMKYDITYEDLTKQYTSYIAECNMSKEKKQIAFKNYYNKEASLVKYEIACCFVEYAKSRGINDFKENLDQTYNKFKSKRDSQNNISDDWIKRNSKCWKIVKYMKINGIVGFETTEEHHNLPTVEELNLLQLMSTTLSITSLKHMIEKLGFEIDKI